MVHFLTNAINQYGYIVLFTALFLELLALPLPGEIIMCYVGFMVFQGHLNWFLSILAGGLGASIGMTLAYWIGFRLGTPFVSKYGRRVHMGPERVDKISEWFAAYGYKLFAISFFVPGVRHVTGYFAGVTRIPFRKFALYTYGGAFFWAATFITIGKLLGPQWEKFHTVVSKYSVIATIGLFVLFILIYMFKRYKQAISRALAFMIQRSLAVFHSLGRVKFMVALMGVICLALTLLSIGLIQDFMSSEFDQFNMVGKIIANSLIEEGWFIVTKFGHFLVSLPMTIFISLCIVIWVFVKSRERVFDITGIAIVLIGGVLWGELLQKVFHRIGPPAPTNLSQITEITFPSEPSLMAIILYGCAAYMVFRYTKWVWLKRVIGPVFIIVLLFIGFDLLIYEGQVPSDIVAGFAFGGVWVTLQFVLLEVFRFIKKETIPMAPT
jgi:membrane protein DedA with SNARE-associated domain